MRCLSAVFAVLVAALVWLPSTGSADEALAIAHPPNWDQSLAIVHATGASLGALERSDGVDALGSGEGAGHNGLAASNGNGATPSASNGLPLAITVFSTSE